MKRLLLIVAAGFSLAANAEYRSIDTATVLYDAPSQRGDKLFVIKRETPVEVVVGIEAGPRCATPTAASPGSKKYLTDKRTVIVTADRAEVRQKAEEGSPLVFEAEKYVALDYLEAAAGGWIKVRHRDGQSGFVRANQIWGF